MLKYLPGFRKLPCCVYVLQLQIKSVHLYKKNVKIKTFIFIVYFTLQNCLSLTLTPQRTCQLTKDSHSVPCLSLTLTPQRTCQLTKDSHSVPCLSLTLTPQRTCQLTKDSYSVPCLSLTLTPQRTCQLTKDSHSVLCFGNYMLTITRFNRLELP